MKRPYLTLALCAALGLSDAAGASAAAKPYITLLKHSDPTDFQGELRGLRLLEDGGATLKLAASGLEQGENAALYGPGRFFAGTFESKPLEAKAGFDTAIASWNAVTPPGTWLQIELRAYRPDGGGRWTRYYNLGVWTSQQAPRRSVDGQKDADGSVSTDTLLLKGKPVYTRVQYRLKLFTRDPKVTPAVRLVAVMTSDSEREKRGLPATPDRSVWGRVLNVPPRSQMVFKDGGEVWCSPTSTSMVLAYWGHEVPVPQAAAATFDATYKGNGNWPFNTAWASTFGLEAYVTRLTSLADVERYIAAGVPVIVSYGWKKGELPGAAIESSNGHLMVVVGFDARGNVVVNDPAGKSDAEVRRTYDRKILERLWLTHSGGTVYLIYPRGHTVAAR
ncbi:uncharacterized protein YvpB [Deinobacterium chartae]|uniref:Uncharacterized protein YvpB n=1 Tax=Deinobacterium chartae TaxID=521158 RepID=A0A841I547_9DEIO|nr:peptidase C39 family protein [Deinobacterium chartae]MBB6099072.1 uncharacterized protein YvpB [Deinobacterium chartae]